MNQTLAPEQVLEAVERAKLAAVRHLVGIITQVNPLALSELLYRLELSFKNRLILTPEDDATPTQMAQALLTAVLMAAITIEEPGAAQQAFNEGTATRRDLLEPALPDLTPAGQYAVIDTLTHEVIKSFATEDEAHSFLAAYAGPADEVELVDRENPRDISA